MNWTSYLTANADLQAYWASLPEADKAQFQNDPARFAEWHWTSTGQNEGRPGGPALTQSDVMNQIDNGPLLSYALDDLDARNQYATTQNLEERTLTANEYNDANAQSAANEAAMRGEGQSAYDDRLGLLTQDYTTRMGLTDAEVAAWEARALTEKQRNEDQVASRFGISGQHGAAVRNLGEVGEQYAQDRALYEGGARRSDYNDFSGGRYAAYGDLARVNEEAAGNAGAERRDNLANYYNQNRGSNRAMWSQYGSAYDSFSGGRAANYSDWLNAQNRASDMGFNAMQLAANAGQVATNNINTATQNAADAYGQSQYARADANSNMWNNIGSTLGGLNVPKWGGSTGSSTKPATTNAYGGYMTGNIYG